MRGKPQPKGNKSKGSWHDGDGTPSKFTGNSTFDFYFHELILTFTTEKSLFSSKKIERFIIFTTLISITITYISLNIKEIESLELVELIGLWLTYGGYNTFQGYRDKKLATEEVTPPIPDEIPEEDKDENGVIIRF